MDRIGSRLKKLPIGQVEPKFGVKFCAQSPLFPAKMSGLFEPKSDRAKKID